MAKKDNDFANTLIYTNLFFLKKLANKKIDKQICFVYVYGNSSL